MWRQASLSLLLVVGLASPASYANPIDLNDFFFFPGDPVVVAPDGSSATIGETPASSSVVLSNDPGLGDPLAVVPASGRMLSFDFMFSSASPNADFFEVTLFDVAAGPLGPPLAGPGFTVDVPVSGPSLGGVGFLIDTPLDGLPIVGTASIDLSPFVGIVTGLQFLLGADFADAAFSSTLSISNLRAVDAVAAPVPEPGTTSALLIGVVLLAARARRT